MRRVLTVFALTAMAALVPTVTPADAEVACPADRICLFEGPEFQGAQENVAASQACTEVEALQGGARSAINGYNEDALVFQTHGCGGEIELLEPGQRLEMSDWPIMSAQLITH